MTSESAAGHVVLLGDSIFDNAAYVAGGSDVVAHLRAVLPAGWRATLCAVDGDTTAGIPHQVSRIPGGATHLVVSVGGNDALGSAHLLGRPASSVAEGIAVLGDAQGRFAPAYDRALQAVLAVGLPTATCSIYDTRRSEPDHAVIRSGLALFNDVITRAAFSRGLPLIDLRLICTEDGDYANPIEPSVQGGRKIAAAIARWLEAAGTPGRSQVYREV